jgi:hypothetical protein
MQSLNHKHISADLLNRVVVTHIEFNIITIMVKIYAKIIFSITIYSHKYLFGTRYKYKEYKTLARQNE